MKNDRLAWPMILLLLTVLVPSIGMVWMMREAVQNERAASDQRLRDVYQVQLQAASKAVSQQWEKQVAGQIDSAGEQKSTRDLARFFAETIRKTGADSLLICDPNGSVLYPASAKQALVGVEESSPPWKRAQQLEFEARDYSAAADSYAAIGVKDVDAVLGARAQQARVRCLLQLGKQDAAIQSLKRQQDGVYDSSGRSFAAAAKLRLLGLVGRDTEEWKRVARRLAARLSDYEDEEMASSQRLFLMTQLQNLTGDQFAFPLKDAEALASKAANGNLSRIASTSMRLTSLPGIWCQRIVSQDVVLLFRNSTLQKQLAALANEQPLPPGAHVSLIAPGESQQSFVEASLGETLGDWRLVILTPGDMTVHQTTQQRNALHGWIACLVVAVTCVLAWLLYRSLRQQLRLAQLKNDLVATVSHELKTPLASIRLLVDTLLDSDHQPNTEKAAEQATVQTREYLQLISLENARLTRLIDGFLTFSRIEGGMQSFDFQKIDVREVITQATKVFGEHYDTAEGSLQVNASEPTWISGDMDLLVTAVVNLLENAWKYSDQDRRITLRVDDQDDQVAISVRDNGIGMRSHDTKQIFDRFYQVDQRVARTRGGCGLGLSIVHAIVGAHGGTACVESQFGVGSTFSLLIPKPDTEIRNIEMPFPQENAS